jgi:drug/metabolite transporter (DMT)-like permease
MATNPLFPTLLAAVILGERPTARYLAALPIALVGVAVVVTQGKINSLLSMQLSIGDVLMLGADRFLGAVQRAQPPLHAARHGYRHRTHCGAIGGWTTCLGWRDCFDASIASFCSALRTPKSRPTVSTTCATCPK